MKRGHAPDLQVSGITAFVGTTARFAPVLFLLAACRPVDEAEPRHRTDAGALRPEKRVRRSTAAGSFYPGTPEAVRAGVAELFSGVQRSAGAPVRVLLAPHAGWEFSGRVAATAFRQVERGFDRVVIIAANHDGNTRFDGVSVDRATHYEVPGFEVAVAPEAARLLELPGFREVPAAHAMHMIEVELPLLAEVLGRSFEIVPMIVGRLTRPETRSVADELARLAEGARGKKTLFVFSVDLSHYYTYDEALALDRPCLDALSRMDADDVARCDTDGTQVLLVMTELAARLGLTPRLLDYRNSGDVTGDRSRVVGYGAMVFEDRLDLGSGEEQALLELARSAIDAKIRDGRDVEVPRALTSRFPRLGTQRGAFVTLKKSGELRGCIGSLAATEPLAEDVAHNAVSAALEDPRFPPVRPDELAKITLSISVLEQPRALDTGGLAPEALLARLGSRRPGVILSYLGRRSTFLPEVWEELPDPGVFLAHLCRKQGSPEGCWRERGARFETYGSEHFSE
ncbi:MAG: AmmeMemoRadiSam system protein B [Deltaproteobacteria bacterium]|nr:AmmeMemoRadiSam system protein B [Deltaproteobacteria bacterium]